MRPNRRGGFAFEDVVTANIYIADVKRLGEMDEGYAAFFPSDPPARETQGVRRLANANALVEVMVMAVK